MIDSSPELIGVVSARRVVAIKWVTISSLHGPIGSQARSSFFGKRDEWGSVEACCQQLGECYGDFVLRAERSPRLELVDCVDALAPGRDAICFAEGRASSVVRAAPRARSLVASPSRLLAVSGKVR